MPLIPILKYTHLCTQWGFGDNNHFFNTTDGIFLYHMQRTHGDQFFSTSQVDGLVQERRNSIANTLELRLSCTNLLKWGLACNAQEYKAWMRNNKQQYSTVSNYFFMSYTSAWCTHILNSFSIYQGPYFLLYTCRTYIFNYHKPLRIDRI